MQRTPNSPKASSILARSIATGLPFGQNLNPLSKMKNLSNIDMSDLAKEWEAQMSPRKLATAQREVEGVKIEKAKLAPRPLWNAP